MKPNSIVLVLTAITLLSCKGKKKPDINSMDMNATSNRKPFQSGFSDVNGIKMYYEIYPSTGQAGKEKKPLVLIHGGGSTIQTSFGRVIPLFSNDRQLICVELQAHGRTGDRATEISFEQDADDVTALLKNLHIEKSDFFGFSNGGMTALQIAIRHPRICNKIVAGSVLLKRNGAFPGFWEFMKNGTFDQMPQQYKEAFLKVTPDSAKLHTMYQKSADRMLQFTDYTDDQLKSIKAPVLLINGDQDVATNENIVTMSKIIPHCRLAIIPGGHGAYIGEITTLASDYKNSDFITPLIENFLNRN